MKKNIFVCLLLTLLISFSSLLEAPLSFAATSSSTNFIDLNPVITSGQQSSSSTNFRVGQSLSQSVIGKASSTNFQLWSGFQYFFTASTNTLTATPGNSQVNLTWSVPQTFLGARVGSYELGVGTTSGNYTYQNVGSVTSFLKTGLTNGVQYFFKVKSKTAGGTVLTFSNEAVATPTGTTTTPPGGGGGGGNYGNAQVTFSGTGYPNSKIFLLNGAQQVGSTTADSNGNFQVSSTGLNAGQFQFALYAQDSTGRRSPLVLESINLAASENKAVNGIIIPPTIGLDNIEVKQGQVLNVFGFAQKNSQVTITVTGLNTNLNFQTQSLSDGSYSLTVQTKKLTQNSYQIFSTSLYNLQNSAPSLKLNFIVGDKTVPAPIVTACPAAGDLNGDCKVDLVDFSILAYWYLKPGFPPEVDFNHDGVVDLIDFSILAYNWTG